MCDHFSQKEQSRTLAQFDWHKQDVNKSFCNRAVASSLRLTGLINWAVSSNWKGVFLPATLSEECIHAHQARAELGLTACHADVTITPLLPCSCVSIYFGGRPQQSWLYFITGELGIAQLIEHQTEKLGSVLTQVRVSSAAWDFSPRVNFECRLWRCLYSPHVHSQASTSVCTLKIPNTGSHTIVRTTWKHCRHW